jgi:hypothetical protein
LRVSTRPSPPTRACCNDAGGALGAKIKRRLQRIERHALVLEGEHDSMRLHAQVNGLVPQQPWYEGVLDAVHEHHLEQQFQLECGPLWQRQPLRLGAGQSRGG